MRYKYGYNIDTNIANASQLNNAQVNDILK